MRIRPLHDRVLLRRLEGEETSPGGIVIPDSAKEKPLHAQVIAVGTGRLAEDGTVVPLQVKAGDRVLIGKYSGNELKVEGEEHLIVRENEVLAILE